VCGGNASDLQRLAALFGLPSLTVKDGEDAGKPDWDMGGSCVCYHVAQAGHSGA